MTEKIAVLMGGISKERKISILSGLSILDILVKSNKNACLFDTKKQSILDIKSLGFDKVFIALHGKFGEDGQVQSILNYLNVPYTGSGAAASTISFDKIRSKLIWKSAGFTVAPFISLNYSQSIKYKSQISNLIKHIRHLGLPLFIKPNKSGSSLGTSKLDNLDDILSSVKKALVFDDEIIIEKFIPGIEITVGILNNKVLSPIEIKYSNSYYDFSSKYISKDVSYMFPKSLSKQNIQHIKNTAFSAWKILGCTGIGRIDMILNPNKKLYLLEVNTVPGMTKDSLFTKTAEHSGISYSKLILKVLDTANINSS